MTILRQISRAMLRAGVLLWAFAMPAFSETAVVRSGAHEGFSRLVIRFDEQTPWQFGRVDGGYALKLSRPDLQMDLSRIYDLISTERISAARYDPTKGWLLLTVDCDCSAIAFAPDARSVAVDVRDGEPDPDSPFEARLPQDTGRADPLAENDTRPAPPRNLTAAGQDDMNLAFLWRNQPAPTKDLSPERQAAISEAHVTDPPESRPDKPPLSPPLPAPDLSAGLALGQADALRNDLLLQLSRATSQGLVSPVEDRLLSAAQIAAASAPTSSAEAEQGTETMPTPTEPQDTAQAVSTASHLRIRTDTSIDQATGASEAGNETEKGLPCPDDQALDLTGWAEPGNISGQIAGFNRALVGEFDAPDPATVTGYIRFYLSLGFGAEAKALMREFPDEQRDDALFTDLADIMDMGHATGNSLTGMQSCPGNAALWSVLTEKRLNPSVTFNRKAVLAGFSALPLHLRRHLFPALSERFLDTGDRDMTTALRAALTRTGNGHGNRVRIADADLAAATGDIEESKAILGEIIAHGAGEAPEALVRLVDMSIANRSSVDVATVASVEALAYEHRGTALGEGLARAHVMAAAANGALDDAFAALSKLQQANLTGGESESLALAFALGLMNSADATFMRIALIQMPYLSTAPFLPEDRLALAGRMLDLGLPQQSRALLHTAESDPAAEVLLARTHLAENDADKAIAILADRNEDEALTILAQAFAASGDHQAAAETRAKLSGDAGSTSRADAAWRTADWAAVAREGEGTRQAAARLVSRNVAKATADTEAAPVGTEHSDTTATDESTTSAASGPLARSNRLIEESRNARDTIRALLAEATPTAP